jgi:hypothetical protein
VCVAGENQQLLLLTGTMKNPQKQDTSLVGISQIRLRVFGSTPGQTYHVETVLEAESLRRLNVTLKPGESVRYTIVLRVPAERPALKMAFLRRDGPVRRYDLEPVVTTADSAFARDGLTVSSSARTRMGTIFDLDAFDFEVKSVREVSRLGAYTSSAGKRLYAADVQVTNRMLVPERWGWQYCTPELKDASDKPLHWSRDMLDAQTGQSFSRDLAAGETATVVYLFDSGTDVAPTTLTLEMEKTKRQVDIALRP